MRDKVTYSQLDKALSMFGYRMVTGEDFVAFFHPNPDAIIVLPLGTPETMVRPVHLYGAERSLELHGVASSAAFRNTLREVLRPVRVKRPPSQESPLAVQSLLK